VDVQVVDRQGQPIATLGTDQFDVSIDGRPRRVVSADLVQYSAGAFKGKTPRPPRIFVLAVDETSFRSYSARAARQAAAGFIDRLEPDDVVGIYPYPVSTQDLNLSHDHAAVKKSLDRVVGRLEPPHTQFSLSLPEMIDITANDSGVLAKVRQRECAPSNQGCPEQLQLEATALARFAETQVTGSLNGLRTLLRALASLQGRKTMVVISGGLPASERAGSRPDIRHETEICGQFATVANANLYVLHMDTSFLDAFSSSAPRLNAEALFRDSSALAAGLELVSGAAGGALFRVQASTADSAFARLARETSAYYALGVEPADADRDGKLHAIHVNVKERGATVRSRATVIIPRGGKS
jgi:VWFA-related protein